jgi:hypothetical protein
MTTPEEAAGMAARVASSGAFTSPTCTRLMTVQETLEALGGAGGATVTAHRGSLSRHFNGVREFVYTDPDGIAHRVGSPL